MICYYSAYWWQRYVFFPFDGIGWTGFMFILSFPMNLGVRVYEMWMEGRTFAVRNTN